MEVKKVTKDVRIYPPAHMPAIAQQLLEDGVDFKITHLRRGLLAPSVGGISIELTRIPPIHPFIGDDWDYYDLAFTRAENATRSEPAWVQQERDDHEGMGRRI